MGFATQQPRPIMPCRSFPISELVRIVLSAISLKSTPSVETFPHQWSYPNLLISCRRPRQGQIADNQESLRRTHTSSVSASRIKKKEPSIYIPRLPGALEIHINDTTSDVRRAQLPEPGLTNHLPHLLWRTLQTDRSLTMLFPAQLSQRRPSALRGTVDTQGSRAVCCRARARRVEGVHTTGSRRGRSHCTYNADQVNTLHSPPNSAAPLL